METTFQHGPEPTSSRSVLDFARYAFFILLDDLRRWDWLDWGLLLALALGLFAASPFLVRPGLPRKTDAELHVYRAAELQHILRQGVFYPRWAPNLYLGYGYPIFNYYAPLTYYLANLCALMPGLTIVGGVKAIFVLGLLLAAMGSYLLARNLFGPAAGVIAAASFTFAPYIVFVDPHARGDLAEHFAICLLPLTFCFFHRLMTSPSARRWPLLGSVLTLAAVVFSHNLLGLVTGGLLAAYWLWQLIFGTEKSHTGWGALAFVLAAALIAFFWLPFLLERSAVKLDVIGPGHFDFRRHFLSLREMLGSSQRVDWGAVGPRFRHNLGMAQWVLALPSIGVLLGFGGIGASSGIPESKPGQRARFTLAYFALAGLGLIFLMVPLSKVVWESVPVMPYMQFPWRLLGPANLMLAVCAAGAATLLPVGAWWREPLLAVGLAVVLALALPLLYPPPWEAEFGGTTPADSIRWEWENSALGTTSTGDFLPTEAAQTRMHPEASLITSYETSGPVDKVNRATLPDDTTVKVVEHGPLQDRLSVSTTEPFLLRLYTFYFPGWHAYVDGEEVEIEMGRPEGFITFWVPAGEHEVLVRFEDTPPRIIGWAISAVGLVSLIVALILAPADRRVTPCRGPSGRWLVWMAGALMIVVGFKELLVDPRGWLYRHSSPGEALVAQQSVKVSFDGQIELLGYDLPKRSIRSGQTLSVVLYWRAQTSLEHNYQSFVHLANPLHVLWGQKDHLNPGELPTQRWPTDRYVWDEYKLRVLPGTPPGDYMVNVGLYSMWDGYRLQRYDEQGQVAGDSLVIGSITVKRPLRQPPPSTLDMAQQISLSFPEGGVTLLGYTNSRERVTTSESWTLTLFWRADQKSPAVERRDIVLLDSAGREVLQHPASGAPVDGRHPFQNWRSGEVVRDQLVFAPTDLPPGVYQVGLKISANGLLGPEGSEAKVVRLGTVEYIPDEH